MKGFILTQSKSVSNAEVENPYGGTDEHAEMFGILLGAARSQVVHGAARFSFADHLSNGPLKAAAMASAEGLNPDATHRLMRACASFGLMTYDEQHGFSGTPLLRTLRRDDPTRMRDTAVALFGRGFWLPLGQLHEAVRAPGSQSEQTLGSPFWVYYESSRGVEEARAFTGMMDGMSQALVGGIGTLIDTKGLDLALDVGGASGSLVHALMQANPDLHGAVLDLEHVVSDAVKAAEARGLRDRFETHSGDFLAAVPAADLYLLKFILHDWPDEQCLMILRNCRRSLRPGGRLAIAELVLNNTVPSPFDASVDLWMMTLLGTRERTYNEYAALLDKAGFRATGLTATASPFSIIEAVAS